MGHHESKDLSNNEGVACNPLESPSQGLELLGAPSPALLVGLRSLHAGTDRGELMELLAQAFGLRRSPRIGCANHDNPDCVQCCKECGGSGLAVIHPEGIPFSQTFASMVDCPACSGRAWGPDLQEVKGSDLRGLAAREAGDAAYLAKVRDAQAADELATSFYDERVDSDGKRLDR